MMEMATDGQGAKRRSEWVRVISVLAPTTLISALIAAPLVWLNETGVVEGGASERLAWAVGVAVVAFGLIAASVRASARFVNAEEGDDLRRQSGALLLGAAALVAAGSSLILLSLAGSGGLLPAGVALAGVLLLHAVIALLLVVRWRLLDELGRAMAKESASLAFKVASLFGGGWATLAHLGFVPGPAPLDWLTMFQGAGLAASVIEVVRRG